MFLNIIIDITERRNALLRDINGIKGRLKCFALKEFPRLDKDEIVNFYQ